MQEFKMQLPDPVLFVIEKLQKNGFSAHVVGGSVRDALSGIPPHDFDITTNATPEEMLSVFESERTIPTGLAHGTITVLSGGEPIEVTTYRIDGAYSDARHPEKVTFTRSLREDAARRDFTVNAMAWSPYEGLSDFFGGREDLQNGILRAVGDPATRFQEDALRILRALRFSATLGLKIHPETEIALRQNAHLLKKISAERIAEELKKLLCGRDATEILRRYLDVFGILFPSLLPMKNFDQRNSWHIYDVWEHTLHAFACVPPVFHMRFTALFHDAGKPATFHLDENGIGHFYGHWEESAKIAKEVLEYLKIDNETKERILQLIFYHDIGIEETDALIRRRLSKLGEKGYMDLLDMRFADWSAQGEKATVRLPLIEKVRSRTKEILAEKPCLSVKELAIGGEDLAGIGFSRGPEMGKCLSAMLEKVLDGEVPNEKESLLASSLLWKEESLKKG